MISREDDPVRFELERIAATNDGVLTPDAVVKAAEPEESPLHDRFEWDDSVAAHQYRIEQARTLIRSVRVVVTSESRKIETVYYVRNPQAEREEQGYVSLQTLRSDDELARDALRSEFFRAEAVLERAKSLAAALDMQDEVEEILENVRDLRAKVA